MHKLISLQDGERGVLETVACGPRAIPGLRDLLFQREPSGLFQPRCRAVDALAALGAHDVLVTFLLTDRDIADPVERAGEDAVLNATARALRETTDDTVIRRLFDLAETRRLAGPIEVLGAMQRAEALPCLLAALADDYARPVAEEAIRQFGHRAAPGLLVTASEPEVQDGSETESSLRRRRAALSLLLELGAPPVSSAAQRSMWAHSDDPELAVSGSRMALRDGDPSERQAAITHLLGMLPAVDWTIRREIETSLVDHAAAVRPIIQPLLPQEAPSLEDRSGEAEAQRSLIRIAHRLDSG